MRVLVAGRNAKALAQAAGAFASDLAIETATSKAAALALLGRSEFDLVLACEKLGDGLGLEVLSHVAVNTPDTLRIFAARPSTLELLEGELGLFGLYRTLTYPINFRKLWAAIDLARSSASETLPAAQGPKPARRVPDASAAKQAQRVPASAPVPKPAQRVPVATPPKQIKHVVLDAAWESAKPQTQMPVESQAQPQTQVSASQAPASSRAPASPARTPAPTAPPASTRSSAPRTSSSATPRQSPPARIPESEAFKRARARRNRVKGRQEPSIGSESLAQLAKLATTRRPTYEPQPLARTKKRTALFVGSGVFAAGAAAVLAYFMVSAHGSVGPSPLPVIASIDRPVPQSVLPWQPVPTQDPTPIQDPTPPQTTFVPNEPVTPAAADMEVEAEAASEPVGMEPGHPGPPPPNPPPGPAEPPWNDASGMPIEE